NQRKVRRRYQIRNSDAQCHVDRPFASRPRCDRGLVVVMYFEQQATALGFERAMWRAWWPARIGVGTEADATVAVLIVTDDQIARQQIDLLPVFVHERLHRVHAGREAQMAGSMTALRLLVEEAREDLLLDS